MVPSFQEITATSQRLGLAMNHYSHLWLFFILVLGVVALPGLDMAFVLASAVTGGRRAGLSAVAGIMSAAAWHVAVGATGIAVLLKVSPAAFNALLWVGALYVAWIGFSIFRSGVHFVASPEVARRSTAETFRRGALTNLLNPKAYVFMLAVFPRFFRPEFGTLWIQALVLWTIIAATQAAVYGAIALAGGHARGWLELKPAIGVAVARSIGSMLMVIAVVTAYEGWHGLS